jgi:hypothetical protein
MTDEQYETRVVVVIALLSLLVLAFVAVGCGDNGRRGLRDPPFQEPTPIVPIPPPLRIDYRVTGTIRGANITYFTSKQGTTQTSTDLPFFVSYDSRDPSTFVYLAAEAPLSNVTEGTLLVQIFVNDVLFREARSSGFSPSVTVSGEVLQ